MIRAITWETAHKDIEQQKSKNVDASKLKIIGVSYDKSRSNKDYFRNDSPPEIKALAKNLYDRINPLWDGAMQYVNKLEFVYEIKQVYMHLAWCLTNKVRLCERSEPQSNRLLDKPGLDEASSWFLMEIAF